MLTAIAAVVSIAVSLAMGVISVHSSALGGLNQAVRAKVMNLTSVINSQLANKRLSASKLLSLLNSKSANALSTYLYSNPLVSKSIQELNKDAALINEYSNQLQEISNEIESYKGELQSLGYSQSHSGVTKERKKAASIQSRIDEAQARYDRVVDEAKRSGAGSVNVTVRPTTNDIDATTQNIKGGQI